MIQKTWIVSLIVWLTIPFALHHKQKIPKLNPPWIWIHDTVRDTLYSCIFFYERHSLDTFIHFLFHPCLFLPHDYFCQFPFSWQLNLFMHRLLVEGRKGLVGVEVISLDVDGQDCDDSLVMCFPRPVTVRSEECPHDYLRIYDGRDEESPVIATLCGWFVPNSFILSIYFYTSCLQFFSHFLLHKKHWSSPPLITFWFNAWH